MGVKNSVSKILNKRNHLGNIELDSFEKRKESGIVFGSNAMCWFKFDDGRILFKEYDNDLEAFGEVLYSEVAAKYGVECAKYDFASYKNKIGTISYDVAFDDGKIAIDGVTLFARYGNDKLPDMITKKTNNLEVIRMFNKKYNNYEQLVDVLGNRYPQDLDGIKQELIKTFILDVLFDHVDKNLWNLMIVTDEYGKNAHLVSIDNSHVACLYRGKEYIKNAVNSLLTSDGGITIEDYLSAGVYGYDVDVKERDYNPTRDLIEFYRSNEEKREEISSFLKSIEINDIMDNLEKTHKIDPIVDTWIKAVVNSRKSFLLRKFYHINDNFKEEHNKKNFHLRRIVKK